MIDHVPAGDFTLTIDPAEGATYEIIEADPGLDYALSGNRLTFVNLVANPSYTFKIKVTAGDGVTVKVYSCHIHVV